MERTPETRGVFTRISDYNSAFVNTSIKHKQATLLVLPNGYTLSPQTSRSLPLALSHEELGALLQEILQSEFLFATYLYGFM